MGDCMLFFNGMVLFLGIGTWLRGSRVGFMPQNSFVFGSLYACHSSRELQYRIRRGVTISHLIFLILMTEIKVSHITIFTSLVNLASAAVVAFVRLLEGVRV